MKLADYISSTATTREDFAAVIGVDVASVCRYINGTRRPKWDVIATIKQVTGGQVTADDFLELEAEESEEPQSA